MNQVLETVLAYLAKTSPWELTAVALALAYVVLAIKRSLWCWLCAFISAAIYSAIMFQARLYMETALQVFYVAMAVYGYREWQRGRNTSGDVGLTRWSLRTHAIVLIAIAVIGGINGWILKHHTNAAWPYVDALITWGSVATTWMVTRRVIENWLYWIVIDGVGAYIYFQQDLHPTGVLFIVYTGIAVYGCWVWMRASRASSRIATIA